MSPQERATALFEGAESQPALAPQCQLMGSVMRAPSCDVLLGCRTGRQVAGGEPVAGQVG